MSVAENTNVPHAVAFESVVHHRHRLRVACFPNPLGLQIEGELDSSSLPVLVRLLDSIPGDRDIYVDLAGLEFIDVGGLRALVTAAAKRRAGHVLTLRSAPPQVHRLLDLTGWCTAPGLHLDAPTPSPVSAAPRRPTRASVTNT